MGSRKMQGFEELCGEDVAFVLRTDPLVLEFNRLQNQLKEKDKELGKAHCEIKALRATEVLKDKALEELGADVKRLEQKLSLTGNHLEQKNLDIKKLTDEKKEALAAQYAAEATLRRVYATQKDDDSVPIELLIAPIEAELKMHKNEVAALQEDKRSLERLMKSKEAALLEAERILRSALERALIVEEVQNQNFELRRQIEICQEENKILDKTNRQKILEVEKLSQTIEDLEEAILAGGAAANTIRDYRRKISEVNEEKRTLERELARVKVSANRVATVVANEWKDDKDKVMPVKQWLEERRILQAEMQKLKDKLAISERAAKAESLMKDKLKMRLKTLEEGLKRAPICTVNASRPLANGISSHFFGILSSTTRSKKRTTSQPRLSTLSRSPMQIAPDEKRDSPEISINDLKKKNPAGERLLRKSLWASSRNKVVDSGGKENAETCKNAIAYGEMHMGEEITHIEEIKEISEALETASVECEDMVSGFLYDKLQKEVLNLRKACELKESTLNSKDEEIKLLMKRVETLTRAIEVESKKVKREAAIREKYLSSIKADEKIKNTNSSKR